MIEEGESGGRVRTESVFTAHQTFSQVERTQDALYIFINVDWSPSAGTVAMLHVREC